MNSYWNADVLNVVIRDQGDRRVPRGRGVSVTAYGEQVPEALGIAEGEAVAPAPVGVPHRGRAYPAEGLRIRLLQLPSTAKQDRFVTNHHIAHPEMMARVNKTGTLA